MPPSGTRPLVRAAAMSVQFLHASINGIAALPALENALGRDAHVLRAETELVGRWSSQVMAEIDSLRQGILGAITVRRHRLGATALRAYQVSRGLTRYNENAVLLPHIEAMKRALNGTRRRAAQPEPQPRAVKP